MSLTFIVKAPCGLCGYRNHGVFAAWNCRVNKHSLVIGRVFGSPQPYNCRECGAPMMDPLAWPVHLDKASIEKVAAARAKRGWLPTSPPLRSIPGAHHNTTGAP